MGFDTIIANGKVVTATDTYLADIAISAGKIEVVGQNLPRQNAARVLEAMGKYVFPGGIDVQGTIFANSFRYMDEQSVAESRLRLFISLHRY